MILNHIHYLQLYRIVQMYDSHYQKGINRTNEILSTEDIIVMQKFPHCVL